MKVPLLTLEIIQYGQCRGRRFDASCGYAQVAIHNIGGDALRGACILHGAQRVQLIAVEHRQGIGAADPEHGTVFNGQLAQVHRILRKREAAGIQDAFCEVEADDLRNITG